MINKLQAFLEQKGIDFALFYNNNMYINPNFYYFSSFKGIGALIVGKEPFLLVPKMELSRARMQGIRGIKVYPFDKKRAFESIFEGIKRKKIRHKRIGIDKNSFSLNSFKELRKCFKAKFIDISSYCSKLREIKSVREIEYIKMSCIYADKIIKKCIENFKDFRNESEAVAFLVYEAKKNSLDMAFEPIIASGRNASMPHYEPRAKITKGFCIIDFGVKYKGYCSDITRTIYVGKPSQKERKIYNKVLGIQLKAISLVKENEICSELYNFVVKGLRQYAKYFTHGLGHGIGVEIHELPNITLNSKDKIRNNMVFTIEPGIYTKNFGMRIEDTILFSNKTKVLTNSAKELLIV